MTDDQNVSDWKELYELLDDKEVAELRKGYSAIHAPDALAVKLVSNIRRQSKEKPSFWRYSWTPVNLTAFAVLLVVLVLNRASLDKQTADTNLFAGMPSLSNTSLFVPSKPSYFMPSSTDINGISLLASTSTHQNNMDKKPKQNDE